ncbi:MAG: cyclic nucleotide-binding domain-containing protein [Anaerolineae bacterium]
MTDVISRLQGIDFMKNLTPDDLNKLAVISRRQRFVAGEDIIKQGDLTIRFFIVDEGKVHLRKTDTEGFEKPVGTYTPGQCFGKAMFTSQEPSEFTAEATGQAWLYVIAQEDFDELTASDPEMLKHMPEVTATRRKLTHGFKWLTPGEYVAYTSHRHHLTLIQALLPPIGAGLLGIAAIGAAMYFDLLKILGDPNLGFGLMGAMALIAGIWGFVQSTDWSDDDFIVTNKRVIHAERKLFISETRNELPIGKIQEMIIHEGNPLLTLLGVADLEIRSGGREGSGIEFDHIANAAVVRKLIEDQRRLLRARQQAEDREKFRSRLSSELRHYVTQVPLEEKKPVPPKPKKPSLSEQLRNMFGSELREGTTITWRKHWVALFRQITFWPLLMLFVVALLPLYLMFPLLSIIPAVGFYAVWGLALLIVGGKIAWEWEDWRNDIYRVTDTMIVDLERLPFGFHSKETTAPFMNVQDAKVIREGPLATMLNFGNVEITVGGGAPPIIFYNVKDPQSIQAEIFRRTEEIKRKIRERETTLQSRNIVDALVAYHRLLMQSQHGENPEPAPPPQVVVVPIPAPTGPPPLTPEDALHLPPADNTQPPPVPKAREAVSEFPPATAFRDE